MFPIPFLVGAALGAGTVWYLKRRNKEASVFENLSEDFKNVSEAAHNAKDAVEATVETIAEKTKAKRTARTKTVKTPSKEQA